MEKIERKIYNLDAANKSIGRLATQIALILRGKNKPEFNPASDSGDIAQVKNIRQAKFTGKKIEQKKYYSYSGYPGGLKSKKIADVFKVNPAEILKTAVYEMLPPVKFRRNMMRRLIIK